MGVIERKAAGGHYTMYMGMQAELLTPSVQHAKETNFCAEEFGIASYFEQGFCEQFEIFLGIFDAVERCAGMRLRFSCSGRHTRPHPL